MPFCKTGADLAAGCRGVRPPPPPTLPEMTCGFLIQLVVCKKKKTMWFWCWSGASGRVHPLLNKILDPPLQNTVEPKGLLKRFYLNDHKLRKICVCGTRNPELWSPEYSRAQGIRNSTNDCNPKSRTWIPESKTVLDLFYMGRQKKET